MKNVILFILLIIAVGLTTIEFQKKILRRPLNVGTPNANTVPSPKPQIKDVPVDMTVDGEYICLPTLGGNSQNAITMECAFGMKLKDGSYIALNVGDFTDKDHTTLIPGTKLHVHGLFVPVEQLNTNQWQKFPIKGILQASEITKITGD